jgi:precorrin-2 dehydrogenase/sirohydrochlorin ferrochelatase
MYNSLPDTIMNTLFPLFVNLKEKPCLVIGGGMVAFRKISGLLESQAAVRVISPDFIPQIHQLCQEKKIKLTERAFQSKDVVGAFLVVAATNDREVNTHISQACAAQNILCNVVDDPELCNFYYASVYTCGDLKIAISTNGVSPTLARKIKAEMAERYSEEFKPYLEYLRRIREVVKENVPEESTRKKILQKIVADNSLLEHCKNKEFCTYIANLDYDKEIKKWLSQSLD